MRPAEPVTLTQGGPLSSHGVTVGGEKFELIASVDVEQAWNGELKIRVRFKGPVPAVMAAIEYERLCAALNISSALWEIGRG